ncbi:hypothetical protein DUI70_3964 [Streptomyces albus]|nr:hypothetical protein DUI70_3964 [Streptomyces albus]
MLHGGATARTKGPAPWLPGGGPSLVYVRGPRPRGVPGTGR